MWALPVAVMLWGCGSMTSDWRDAEKAKSAEAYQDFLKRYPKGTYARDARVRLLQLRWAKLQPTADLDGMAALQKDVDEEARTHKPKRRKYSANKAKDKDADSTKIAYPPKLRSLTRQITARRAELVWEKLRGTSDVDQLNAFLKEFPKTAASRDAEVRLDDLTWASAAGAATPAAWRDYLKRFGNGRHADEARRVAEDPCWNEVRASDDEAVLREHLALFPQGVTAAPARAALAILVWNRAERDKTDVQPYREYLKLAQDGPQAQAAQDALDWASAEDDGTLAAVEQYLRRHPEGLFAEQALAALPTLKSTPPPKVEATATKALARVRQQIRNGLKRTSARGSVAIAGWAVVSDARATVYWRGGGMVSLNQTVPGKKAKTKETYRLRCAFTGTIGRGGLTRLNIKDKPRARLRLDGVSYTRTAEGWRRQINKHFKPRVTKKTTSGTQAAGPR